ncbi:MAG: hypothetical protein H7Z72_22915 [Bacteroidetes bacterium]|nr:hypothetical protein [Fibrella sp.]
MDPLNKTERNTSLFNFIAVYIIVLMLPLCLAFWVGKKYPSGGGNQKAVSEQKILADEMSATQVFIKKMEEIDSQRPQEGASNETWNAWIQGAEQQNNDFRTRVDKFQKNNTYTGIRLTMRDNACSSLYRVNIERKNYLDKRTALLRERDETAELERLKSENARLASEKQGLQNNVNMLTAQLAQSAANRPAPAAPVASAGGGGGGSGKEVENLKWELKYSDANCKKTQADMLEEYNARQKRRQLYTVAKKNFELISAGTGATYALQQLATTKVEEIEKVMNRL